MRRVAAAAVLSVVGLAAGASPAAAANPYTPGEVCGAGYAYVHHIDIATPKVWAKVYLMYNSSSGNNCVVTIKTQDIGTATYTNAVLKVRRTDGSVVTGSDPGSFKYYAGPVKLYGRDRCVQFGGTASDGPGGQRFSSMTDGWRWCGG